LADVSGKGTAAALYGRSRHGIHGAACPQKLQLRIVTPDEPIMASVGEGVS